MAKKRKLSASERQRRRLAGRYPPPTGAAAGSTIMSEQAKVAIQKAPKQKPPKQKPPKQKPLRGAAVPSTRGTGDAAMRAELKAREAGAEARRKRFIREKPKREKVTVGGATMPAETFSRIQRAKIARQREKTALGAGAIAVRKRAAKAKRESRVQPGRRNRSVAPGRRVDDRIPANIDDRIPFDKIRDRDPLNIRVRDKVDVLSRDRFENDPTPAPGQVPANAPAGVPPGLPKRPRPPSHVPPPKGSPDAPKGFHFEKVDPFSKPRGPQLHSKVQDVVDMFRAPQSIGQVVSSGASVRAGRQAGAEAELLKARGAAGVPAGGVGRAGAGAGRGKAPETPQELAIERFNDRLKEAAGAEDFNEIRRLFRENELPLGELSPQAERLGRKFQLDVEGKLPEEAAFEAKATESERKIRVQRMNEAEEDFDDAQELGHRPGAERAYQRALALVGGDPSGLSPRFAQFHAERARAEGPRLVREIPGTAAFRVAEKGRVAQEAKDVAVREKAEAAEATALKGTVARLTNSLNRARTAQQRQNWFRHVVEQSGLTPEQAREFFPEFTAMQEARQSGMLEWGVGGAERTFEQKDKSIKGMEEVLDGEGVKETLPTPKKDVGAKQRVLINGKVETKEEGYVAKKGEKLLGPGSVTIYSRNPAVQHTTIADYTDTTSDEAKKLMVGGDTGWKYGEGTPIGETRAPIGQKIRYAGLMATYKEILRDRKVLDMSERDIAADFAGALYRMGGDVARVWWEVGVPKLSAQERKGWASLRPLYDELPVPVEPEAGVEGADIQAQRASVVDEIIAGARSVRQE